MIWRRRRVLYMVITTLATGSLTVCLFLYSDVTVGSRLQALIPRQLPVNLVGDVSDRDDVTTPGAMSHAPPSMGSLFFKSHDPQVKDKFTESGPEFNSAIHFVVEDRRQYFDRRFNLACLLEGTDWAATAVNKTHCQCMSGWHGNACSVPAVVKESDYPTSFTPKPRIEKHLLPRRIINAIPFNMEYEMLEIRLQEIGDLVDVFLILESNFTAYGKPKPLYLLDKLRSGAYAQFAHKIVHVFLDYFPAAAYTNGWTIDNLLRDHIVTKGLLNQTRGYRDDDVFLLNDADELPRRELVMFLKLHDNYPVPVGLHYQHTIYGFYWGAMASCSHVSAVTLTFLRDVLEWKAIRVRSGENFLNVRRDLVSKYNANSSVPCHLWIAGRYMRLYAGWHCSWCCPAECIRTKLESAQNGDFPRWGDYEEKRNLTYIRHLVRNGLWFDDHQQFLARKVTDNQYAPPYVMKNFDKFKNLVYNQYAINSSVQTLFPSPTQPGKIVRPNPV